MCAPFMSVMILPDCLGPPTPEKEEELRHRLFHNYNVQTNICVVEKRLCLRSADGSYKQRSQQLLHALNTSPMYRICAQVYNTRTDYERLAEALEQEIKLAS